MPTSAQIQAALAAAQADKLTWAEKADLLEYAITTALLPNGEVALPAFMVSADGASVQTMTIEQATMIATKWRSLDSGGVIPQYVEFGD